MRRIDNKETTYKSSNFLFKNIVEMVNNILIYGIENQASDIHIREIENLVKLEYRIDGELISLDIPKEVSPSELIARVKIMSKLNVAQKRMPQDGAMTFTYKKDLFDIRVATLPTIKGENVVLRILKTQMDDMSLKGLGFELEYINILNRVCRKTHGLILVTGPTGSGKSTTLLSLINILKESKRKIITIEDPVENKVDDIVQIQVKEEIGLSFELILRTVLRSDPDIIVISEIRDELTAQIAIRAALTGHLVLATLHTNDAISTFSRLVDMKIPKYLIIDSLLCIVSQRLVRIYDGNKKRICVSEILEFKDEVIDIFLNDIDKHIIDKKLKSLGFKKIEDKILNLINEGKYISG